VPTERRVGFLGPKDKPVNCPYVPNLSIYKSEFNFAKLLTLLFIKKDLFGDRGFL
jgi:hypothetical protein